MPVYTFILDYKGGTYIDQIKSRSLKKAPTIWASKLSVIEISGLGEAGKKQIIEQVEIGEPVALSGLKNVWCLWLTILGKPALINFVATAE